MVIFASSSCAAAALLLVVMLLLLSPLLLPPPHTPTKTVSAARDVLGPISADSNTALAYGPRAAYHMAAGVVQLSGSHVSPDERADAKQHFSKALKIAHGRLHNHQVVSQLLMMMAPLQVRV